MKPLKTKHRMASTLAKGFMLTLMILLASCGETQTKPVQTPETPETPEVQTLVWHIKAVHPEGRFLDVKALDSEGNIFDVKALQEDGQRQVMDVKALMGGLKVPVKILVSEDALAPVKAIGADGTIFNIKALDQGKVLDVKGVRSSGNIIHIKAIAQDGTQYGVKAISPEGQLNDVKGVKMADATEEGTINGVAIYAHIKALPQAEGPGESLIWHVKGIHPEGRTLDIKALDPDGNRYDVKAIQDSGQRQIMDVKALMDGMKVPVKILVGGDPYAPVKAIGADGTIYDIKALSPEGERLDVKGVRLAGNILDIKVVAPDGTFYGVKALSPEGLLNDVKGVKMESETSEGMVNGVEIQAHVKAIPQIE